MRLSYRRCAARTKSAARTSTTATGAGSRRGASGRARAGARGSSRLRVGRRRRAPRGRGRARGRTRAARPDGAGRCTSAPYIALRRSIRNGLRPGSRTNAYGRARAARKPSSWTSTAPSASTIPGRSKRLAQHPTRRRPARVPGVDAAAAVRGGRGVALAARRLHPGARGPHRAALWRGQPLAAVLASRPARFGGRRAVRAGAGPRPPSPWCTTQGPCRRQGGCRIGAAMTISLPGELLEVFERSGTAEYVTIDGHGQPAVVAAGGELPRGRGLHRRRVRVGPGRRLQRQPARRTAVLRSRRHRRPRRWCSCRAPRSSDADTIHVRPERIYVWPSADLEAEPALYDAHVDEVRSAHNEEPEVGHAPPEGGENAWDERLDELDDGVLAFVGPDGFPFAVRVPIQDRRRGGHDPHRRRPGRRADRARPGLPVRP